MFPSSSKHAHPLHFQTELKIHLFLPRFETWFASSMLAVQTGKVLSPSPVQDGLQQLTTLSAQEVPVTQPTPCQVDVTTVDSEITSCFCPIFATKVEFSNGKATDA